MSVLCHAIHRSARGLLPAFTSFREHTAKSTKLGPDSSDTFRCLVDNHLDRVINVCYRFTLNREEAEDLAQETFITVYQSISKFREDSNVSTWIHQIAVRKSLDYLRSKNRQKRRGLFTRLLNLSDPEVETATPSKGDPHDELEDQERRRHLHTALASLPENQRTAFLLSKCDDLGYTEIAAIMKTSVSSVTSLVHRAKINLQQRLTAYYQDFEK